MEQVTVNKNIEIYLDESRLGVSEPAFEYGRQASALFASTDTSSCGIIFRSGWEVKSYVDYDDASFDRTEVQSSVISDTEAEFDSTFIYGFQTRKPSNSNMLNVNAGASANQADQGNKGWKRSIPAGHDLSNITLSADASAFPYPDIDDNAIAMDPTISVDRVFKTKTNDSVDSSFVFCITIIEPIHLIAGLKFRLYFNANSGETVENGVKVTGSGNYCWLVRSNRAVLMEKLVGNDNHWTKRHECFGNWMNDNSSSLIIRVIKSGSCFKSSEGANGFIKTRFTSQNNSFTGSPTSVIENIHAIATKTPSEFEDHYMVPGNNQATSLQPLRLDVRRDMMGSFSFIRYKYRTEGPHIANDAVFTLSDYPSDGQTILLNWDYCKKDGTDLICKLYRNDLNEELDVNISNLTNNKILYNLPAGVTEYFVKCFWYCSDLNSPRLNSWRVKKNAVLGYTGTTGQKLGVNPYYQTKILSFNYSSAEREWAQEDFSFVVADPLNTISKFLSRTVIPVKVINKNSATGKQNIMFRGFTVRVNAQRKSSLNGVFPVTGWNVFNVMCKGQWKILASTTVDTPITTTFYSKGDVDMNGNVVTDSGTTPYLASEFVRSFISRAGYDYDNDFDFPTDIPIRILAGSNLDFSSAVDMLEINGDVIASICKDYLAHVLMRDENIGANGKWVLVPPKVAPFTNLCNFITAGPSVTAGQKKLQGYLPSYSGMLDPNVDSATYGQPIIHASIRSGSFNTVVLEPECNWLLVSGIGAFSSKSPNLTYAVGYNPISYNRPGESTADPTHPDYIGWRKPMWVIDPSLTSGKADKLQAVLATVWRRIAYLSFHAIKMATFVAPMIEIPHETNTNAYRILRYGDPVLVDGAQFLIRNVNPSFKKDGLQFATYECEGYRSL
jgi:hypothetical protein